MACGSCHKQPCHDAYPGSWLFWSFAAGRLVWRLLVPDTPPASRTGKTAIIIPGFIILTIVARIACAILWPE